VQKLVLNRRNNRETAIERLQITAGSARVTSRLVGAAANVMLCTFSGVHTAESLRMVRERLAGRMADGLALAFVNDYRGCALLLNLADTATASTVGLLPRPGAFVCSPAQVSTMAEWARRVAAEGTLRQVFTELCPAVQWAEQEANLGPHPK
jgi:hypothetical protein